MPVLQYFIKPWYCQIWSPTNWPATTLFVHFLYWPNIHFMLPFHSDAVSKRLKENTHAAVLSAYSTMESFSKYLTLVMRRVNSIVQQQSWKSRLLCARNGTDTHWFCTHWSSRKIGEMGWGEGKENEWSACLAHSQSVNSCSISREHTAAAAGTVRTYHGY